MTSIIGRVVLQPASARPAEFVRVEVFNFEDQTFDGSATEISINGVPGAVQYLQFPSAGQHRLSIRALAPSGERDFQVTLLDIVGSPLEFRSPGGRLELAMLGMTQTHPEPYVAVLTLGSMTDARTQHLPTLPTHGWSVNDMVLKSDRLGARLERLSPLARAMAGNSHGSTGAQTTRLVNTKARANKPLPGNRSAKPAERYMIVKSYDLSGPDITNWIAQTAKPSSYEWDFGDGTTATTPVPTVAHDFFEAIDHASGVGSFVVTCTAKQSKVTVRRSLTVHSAYALCKRAGTIVPHVKADLFARKTYNMLNGMFTLYNVEHDPLVLDRLSVTETIHDGEQAVMPRPFVTMDQPITIPPRSCGMVGVVVPFVNSNPEIGQLKYDIKGFTVIYAGTCGAHPVRCSASFDVPVGEWGKRPRPPMIPDVPPLQTKPWPWEIVTAAFNEVINPVTGVFRADQLALDQKTGTIAVTIGAIGDPGLKRAGRTMGFRALSLATAPVEQKLMELRTPRTMSTRSGSSSGSPTSPQARKLSTAAMRDTVLRSAGNRPDLNLAAEKLAIRGLSGGLSPVEPPPQPGPILEGEICDPDNLTEEELAEADKGNLVCQLTTEVKNVMMPGRWKTACKGDIILCPGGDGYIGGLMMQVRPAQWYSHCGIMTKNYEEITHCTGSKRRLLDHKVGFSSKGSDGLEPNVLKYGWPGPITQSVDASIYGEKFQDPEYNEKYSVQAFGAHDMGISHNDQFVMIPVLAVKPDPLQETPAVRAALHAIATDARNNAGKAKPPVKPKYHYRWYAYTDPTIGLGAPEGPAAGWAVDTRGAVCSSYIWLHAQARGAHLETNNALVTPTDLEPTDIASISGAIEPTKPWGAMVRPLTPDGLYLYTKEERLAGANWLFNTIHNFAFDTAGWFGEALTDGSDDFANQVLNAFANDQGDGKDSEEWKNLSDADAVSPDNMMWWDGPSKGGLWGFLDTPHYREPRSESYTVSRWKKVITRGTIHGRVMANGASVSGAKVQVYDGKWDFSKPDGTYRLENVPLGKYRLQAWKSIDQVLHSLTLEISLTGADMPLDIILLPPDERFRKAGITIDFFGRDYEQFDDDEILDPGPEYFELELGPDKTVNSKGKSYPWGHEIHVEYLITVRLLVGNVIDVEVQGTLFEGTDEDNKDLDGQGTTTFPVPVGGVDGRTLTITNTDEDDDDAGVLAISVKNMRNDN